VEKNVGNFAKKIIDKQKRTKDNIYYKIYYIKYIL